MSEEPEITVIVTKPWRRAVIVIDRETDKVLLITDTFSKKIESGVFVDPYDVVETFRLLATRGHETRGVITDYEKAYKVIVQILRADMPWEEKEREVYKYVRALLRESS